MSTAWICRLSPKRLASLREEPSILRDLGAMVLRSEVPGAVHLKQLDDAKRRGLETQFAKLGAGAWEALRRALDGEIGQPLDKGARILVPGEVHVIAEAMAAKPSKVARTSVVRGVRDLFLDARREEAHVLVVSTPPPTRKERLHELVFRFGIHTEGRGLRDADADARRSALSDLRDRLADEEGTLMPPVVGEIRALVIFVAAPGIPIASRELMALLLAEIALLIGRGGDAARDAHARLRADVHEVGEFFLGVMDEMSDPARGALALVAARVDFARDVVLQRLPRDLRHRVREAYAGDERAYEDTFRLLLHAS